MALILEEVTGYGEKQMYKGFNHKHNLVYIKHILRKYCWDTEELAGKSFWRSWMGIIGQDG